ncbi:MAG: SBBP repeat-containing protein, partial [Candidatus Omnitrophica bacterium]|nr:SBBP repeat-containing protein [Candidatus Omnitrophota bacterium]
MITRAPRWLWSFCFSRFPEFILSVAVLFSFSTGAVAQKGDLVWSTFLGSASREFANAVTSDRLGNCYVAGYSESASFPVTTGAVQEIWGGEDDAVIVAFGVDGQLQWSTFLGGSLEDQAFDVVIDGSSNLYVTGRTESDDFVLPNTTPIRSYIGGEEAFVAKFGQDHSLVWFTYLGGASNDEGRSLAVALDGSVFVAGETDSEDFPTTPGVHDEDANGGSDVFVTKLSAGGSLVWSTLLGGSSTDRGLGIVIAKDSGNLVIVGRTQSPNFYTTPGAYDENHNSSDDGFVTKFDPIGAVLWSTYLGGVKGDWCNDVVMDASETIFLAGKSDSMDFPTPQGWDTILNESDDAFVARFSSNG